MWLNNFKNIGNFLIIMNSFRLIMIPFECNNNCVNSLYMTAMHFKFK